MSLFDLDSWLPSFEIRQSTSLYEEWNEDFHIYVHSASSHVDVGAYVGLLIEKFATVIFAFPSTRFRNFDTGLTSTLSLWSPSSWVRLYVATITGIEYSSFYSSLVKHRTKVYNFIISFCLDRSTVVVLHGQDLLWPHSLKSKPKGTAWKSFQANWTWVWSHD